MTQGGGRKSTEVVRLVFVAARAACAVFLVRGLLSGRGEVAAIAAVAYLACDAQVRVARLEEPEEPPEQSGKRGDSRDPVD